MWILRTPTSDSLKEQKVLLVTDPFLYPHLAFIFMIYLIILHNKKSTVVVECDMFPWALCLNTLRCGSVLVSREPSGRRASPKEVGGLVRASLAHFLCLLC